jgi:electron-transferring-flavoprotein dehydrogenase
VTRFLPITHQVPLPLDRLILDETPGEEAIEMDVLFVGAGPAGLAGAIELARLVKQDGEQGGSLGELSIGVLEKAGALGEHSLSGAVVNPRVFRELFPDIPDAGLPFRQRVDDESVYYLSESGATRIPTPPTMRNHGNYAASLSEMVRWLGEQAEALGVNLFPGFPVDALLVEGSRVRGVRTTPTGLSRTGEPGSEYIEPTDLTARVTVLAEGTRGHLAEAWRQWQGIASPNPQIFALGVKEVWQVKRPLDRVIHTLGWPLPKDVFGGTWMYPMGEGQVSVGLVAGLDYRDARLDVHELMQRMKLHPLFREVLEGGTLVEWGAKTIPEGGYYSLPDRLSGDGIVMAGDTAGFKDGFYLGGIKAGLMSLTGGAFPGGRIAMHADAEAGRDAGSAAPFVPDNVLTFSKLDANYKSGNATRDTIPSHLLVGPDISPELAEFYAHMCPAGVYERLPDGSLRVNPPNCVDCKATDILGPRWLPREGGSGPKYRVM